MQKTENNLQNQQSVDYRAFPLILKWKQSNLHFINQVICSKDIVFLVQMLCIVLISPHCLPTARQTTHHYHLKTQKKDISYQILSYQILSYPDINVLLPKYS